MKNITYKELQKQYTDSMKDDYKKANLLFDKQDRTTKINHNVCLVKSQYFYADNSESFDSISETNIEATDSFKEYNGLEQEIKIEYDVDGYCIDGDFEDQSVSLSFKINYLIPFSNIEFEKTIDKKSYLYKRIFKEYISDLLYKEAKENHNTKWKAHLDCKIVELYMNDILDLHGLFKATYSSCKI